MSWIGFGSDDMFLDPETQSETTPRDSEGKPQVGFMEAKRLPPELLEIIMRIRNGKGVDR